LGARLPYDQRVREPAVRVAQVEDDLPPAEVYPYLGERKALLDKLVRDPAHVQQLERTGVQREGAGEVRLLATAFEDLDGDPGGRQVAGEHQAGRPGAHDEYGSHLPYPSFGPAAWFGRRDGLSDGPGGGRSRWRAAGLTGRWWYRSGRTPRGRRA